MDTVTWSLLFGVLQVLYIEVVLGNGCFTFQGSCCILCNPGYFLPQECGTCTPCPATGYTDKRNNKSYCDHCQRCEGIFRYVEKCSSTRNAVCTCIPGKKCTDEKCKRCKTDRCPAGQRLVGQKCMNCPLGTFNTGAEHVCTPWKNCTALGGVIINNGSHTSDVVCGGYVTKKTQSPGPTAAVTTTTKLRSVPEPSPGLSNLDIACIVVPSAVVLFLIAICVLWREKLTEKMKHLFQNIPKPIVKQTEEEDGCSCHFPEEENGAEDEPMTLEA
ncbi:tumor necrosis factor receptor superfamily member 9 [Rhinoderma darwinii]|uniref:tumor necrosis factor receptor superfamily member 9 n=1 Tax=Rhinoderma darwinii TaxID=43563 RepID=UPI003F66C6DE